MKNSIHFLVITLLFFCCQNEKSDTLAPLIFKSNAFELKSALCENENEMECATVKMSYYLAEGGKIEVREKINISIKHILANRFMLGEKKDSTNSDFKNVAKSFISNYEKYMSDEKNQGFITPYSNETDCKIIYDSPELVSFSFSNYSNTGGAHPNYFTLLVNFDKTTGKQIKMEDIIKDKQQLSPFLETLARKKYKVEEDQSLKDIGLYYEGKTFPVNDNIGFLKDSIILEYNPYEVGPYVLGGITFKIAKSKIQDLLILNE